MNLILKNTKGDRVIWFAALLLGLVSVVSVYGSIITLAEKYQDGNTEYYLFKHGLMLGTGFLLMFYTHLLKFKYYNKLSQILIWVAIALLGITLVFGVHINSASRWLVIPVINQNFQTSDFAKIALVLYLSRLLAKNQDKVQHFKEGVLPMLIPIGLVCGLILPANFSTAALVLTVSLILMFVGRVKVMHILAIIGMAIGSFCLLLLINTANPDFLPRLDTWKNRLITFVTGQESAIDLNRQEKYDLAQSKYQSDEAQMAIATGGFLPKGPSFGFARNSLPHPYSDMIYAYIIQTYGSLLGGIGVLLLYLILLFRSIQVAAKCPKKFGSFAAIGLSFMLVFQAMVNMAVAVNLIPVTGQPLPLVSMGGTSIWFTCISLGIILSVSRSIKTNDNQKKSTTGNHVVA